MCVKNISNSSQSVTKFFSCLQASEVIINFSQFWTAVTSDSDAEMRNKQYYRVVCIDKSLAFQSKLLSYASTQFSKF